jgi:hypothetical protein
MDADSILFLEKDVCDGSAWSLKWGTLILYPGGLVFHYNRPRKENPGRMQDVIKINDLVELSVEKIDWMVSKIFWVGRRLVIVKTREGEKRYYMRETEELFTALTMLKPSIPLVKK